MFKSSILYNLGLFIKHILQYIKYTKFTAGSLDGDKGYDYVITLLDMCISCNSISTIRQYKLPISHAPNGCDIEYTYMYI